MLQGAVRLRIKASQGPSDLLSPDASVGWALKHEDSDCLPGCWRRAPSNMIREPGLASQALQANPAIEVRLGK